VNTFLSSNCSPRVLPKEGIRATEEEKEAHDLSRLSGMRTVENVQQAYAEEGKAALWKLQEGGDPERERVRRLDGGDRAMIAAAACGGDGRSGCSMVSAAGHAPLC